jgi:uncharacterized protein (DUF1330 family)
MPAYVVVQITVEDPVRYAEYVSMALAKALRQQSASTEMLLIEGLAG